jgi:hypothetical protein
MILPEHDRISGSADRRGDLSEDSTNRTCFIPPWLLQGPAWISGKKTHTGRDVDILIEGKFGAFAVKIAIESKNCAEPVGVEKVESFKANLKTSAATSA